MSTMDREDTPTGMQPYHESAYLVWHAGHPHPDELNDPIPFANVRPDPSVDGAEAFKEWQDARANAYVDEGSPLPPSHETP